MPTEGWGPGPVGGRGGRRFGHGVGVAAAGLKAQRTRPDAPARGFSPALGPRDVSPPLRAARDSSRAAAGAPRPLRTFAAAARPPATNFIPRRSGGGGRAGWRRPAAVWTVFLILRPGRAHAGRLTAGVDSSRRPPRIAPCDLALRLLARPPSLPSSPPGALVHCFSPAGDTLRPGQRLSGGSIETSAVCPGHPWSLG